jgi:hypothetical protein
MDEATQLTEDKTIEILMKYLKSEKWTIESYCLGQKRGYDIVATKEKEKLIIEVKGAKADDKSPTKKRTHFDSGQIKTHFGKAVIKSFETQNEFPESKVAIAHPDNEYLRRVIGSLIKNINNAGIIHFWVNVSGKVIIEK